MLMCPEDTPWHPGAGLAPGTIHVRSVGEVYEPGNILKAESNRTVKLQFSPELPLLKYRQARKLVTPKVSAPRPKSRYTTQIRLPKETNTSAM